MASAFSFVASEATTEVSASDEVRDVQRTTLTAQPSGVTFSVMVPSGAGMAAATAAAATPIAEAFNTAADHPGVAGIFTSQEVNAAGNVTDVAVVTVTSTSGRSSTTVTVPMGTVQGGDISGAVADARAQLDALESI